MKLPDFSPEQRGRPEQLSSREEFNSWFAPFVKTLKDIDTANYPQEMIITGAEKWLHLAEENLPPPESALFRGFWGLFCRKHALGPFFAEEREFAQKGGAAELTVEIGGPIAVGKTTISEFLADQIGARRVGEVFAPGENPFLAPAYQNSDFMLRAQLFFLLGSINDGLAAHYVPGRWVRDNSPWSDLLFMNWRLRQGIVTPQEAQDYMRLFNILEPVIAKPSLLIVLKPPTLKRLWEGLQARIKAEAGKRKMEKVITKEDLAVVIQAAEKTVEFLKQKELALMEIPVDPVEAFRNPDLRYSTVYAIRERLRILKELLTKDPQKVAAEIVAIFAAKQEPQVVIVHSQSMFTGKTSVLNFVAEAVGREKVVVFQPQKALRYHEEDHEHNMIDRDRRKIPATTITSNRISDILGVIDQQGVGPHPKPFLFIDEVMLFVESDVGEAMATLETLRRRGFWVVVDGLDYTFQELPFKFMPDLVKAAYQDRNWHAIEMGTRCKYCERPARGSRRLKPDGSIADYNDTAFLAGENYEPVCCDSHPSCVGQPKGFVRQPLVTEAVIE